MTSNEAPVLVQRDGALTRIVLNRPRAINALTLEMVEIAEEAIQNAAFDGSRAILIEGAGERGLSGGGDIKAMRNGGPEYATSFVAAEYRLDLLTHTSSVPVIGLMDGVTMGGGIGITGHAPIRVVTERSRLAMPEVNIGIVPDVGGHRLLANAPGRLGEYLAVTANSMEAGDAIALGFADLYVPSDRLETVRQQLITRLDSESPIAIVQEFAEPAPRSPLLHDEAWIDDIFEDVLGRDRPVTIFMATVDGYAELAQWAVAASKYLIARLERSDESAARTTAETLRSSCPTSVAVTLAQIARTRTLDLALEDVLADDLRILRTMFARSDFAEGVRAVVIDKDGDPAWKPSTIEDLDASEVARILAPEVSSGASR